MSLNVLATIRKVEMKRKSAAAWSMMLLFLSMPGQANADSIRPFTADSFNEIRDDYEGRGFMVGLWSMYCAPCLAELKLMGEVLAENPDLPFVLVSTDPIEEREHAHELLSEYGLAQQESWMFAESFAERLRYSIDPQWYGELPRSYFFSKSGDMQRHSGTITLEQLHTWFKLHDDKEFRAKIDVLPW